MDYKEAVKLAWETHEAAFKAARAARMEAIREAWRAYDETASAATRAFKKAINSDLPDEP
ncbi:hypothetical protein ES708_09343 [subsurface metagenome]